MNLYPLFPPDAVARGHVRQLTHGPSTVTEVLQRAVAAANAEDQADAYRADPVAWMRAHRPRRLIDRLLWRCRA